MFHLIKTYFLFRAVIVLLIIFLLFCTILEFSQNWIKENNIDNKTIQILAQFSVFNSSLRILSTKANSGSISAIHGIRALSILWIVYGHENYFGFTSSYVNLRDFLDVSFSFKKSICAFEWNKLFKKISISKVFIQFFLWQNSEMEKIAKSSGSHFLRLINFFLHIISQFQVFIIFFFAIQPLRRQKSFLRN